MARRPILLIASLAALVALWQVAAVIADSRLLPEPATVIAVMVRELTAGDLVHHLAKTLSRVAAAFVLAMALGTAIGIVMGRSRLINRVFDGWLVFFLNIPALVVTILFYVWFGLGEVAAVAAVAVNKIPTVVVIVREGARALDPKYFDVARICRLNHWRTFRHVTAPQLAPYLIAAARSGLSLIWKIVLVVELLGRSDGIGFQLSVYFQLFDVDMILAYTLAFVIVIQVLELAVTQPLEARVARWRP